MDPRAWHKFYEESVPKEIVFGETTLPDVLDRTAQRFPDRTATLFEGGRLTWRELKDRVDRLATALAGLGLKPGDRVAIQLPNLPQAVIAYYATLRAGGTAVMFNPMYVPREIEHQVHDSGAKIAIVLDAFWVKSWRPQRAGLGLDHVIVTAVKDFLPFPKNLLFPLVGKKSGLVVDVPREAGVLNLVDVLASNPPAPPRLAIDPDSLANLQYTGGTTGVSKGAMLSHRNLAGNVDQVVAWFPNVVEGGEVVLCALPFFHVFGLTVCMNLAVRVGGSMVLVPNPRDIPKLIKLIQRYRPTMLPAVPAMFNAINGFPGIEKIDISSIKGCFSGSAPLPLEVLEKFESLTGGKITEGFGMTETSPVTHANPLYGLRKPGSIGIPLPNTDARIVDLEEGTRDVAPGEDGELIVSGPQIMLGYWRNEAETAGMIRDGWLHTGDIAKMDEDGYFYIVGRKKDMIIAGGYNIYPREIDEILYEHPKVLEAAAVGVPDVKRGETVKAFVVLKEGESATEEEIVEFCRSRLAAYKVPRSVEFRKELPKSTIGKVLRRILRDEEVAKQKTGASPAA